MNVITLTGALLGLGMLAGCTSGGSSAAQPSGTASASQASPSASQAGSSASQAGSAGQASPSAASTTPAASMSAAARVHAAQAALRAGGSVHVDITSSAPAGSVVFSDDATASGGRQVITYDKVGHITILFIAGIGYVKANAPALQGFFQVPQPQAQQFADQWIELRSGDKLGAQSYAEVTAGITLSSVAGELAMSGSLTRIAPATIAGQRVVGAQGPMPASAKLPATARDVLYVSDDSLARPVLSKVVDAGTYTWEMSFSQWAEKLHLTAPANAIPASSVTPASVST